MQDAPQVPSSGNPTAGRPTAPRWPRVVGTLGIVVGAIVVVDHLDDLLMLPWLRSNEWWTNRLGEELAASIVRYLPSTPWVVIASAVGMVLGTLLIVGGLRLRRGRRSGAELCRTWAWLAIAWLVIGVSRAFWWLRGQSGEIEGLAQSDWQGAAVIGLVLSLIVLAAFPVFLLNWFSRTDIKAQLAGWPR